MGEFSQTSGLNTQGAQYLQGWRDIWERKGGLLSPFSSTRLYFLRIRKLWSLVNGK